MNSRGITRALAYLAAAIIGIALGVASALYLSGLWTTRQPMDFGNVRVDGWVSDFAVGSDQANPYVRARIARHGLLAMAQSEAVYFVRANDDEGRRLSEDCTYQISGGAMPADWWSITLYQTSNSMLPVNTDAALSIDATNIQRDAEDWRATISNTRPEDTPNWLSSRNSGEFDLLLRLYVPGEALLSDPEATLVPPSVERLGCKGEAA